MNQKAKQIILGHIKKKGITQDDLAKEIGISRPVFNQWLNGKPPKKLATFQKVLGMFPKLKLADLA